MSGESPRKAASTAPTHWMQSASYIFRRLSRCICRPTGSTPGRTDLLLLHIDADRLSAPVRWEPGVPSDPEPMLFPHLYGPLPVAAVTSVTPYQPDADGSFPPLM